MLRVLLIDRANPVFVQSARALAAAVRDLPVQIVFASDKEPSAVEGNLEIVNVHNVPQRLSIQSLEEIYGFSIHRALITERSFFDYSSFRRCQTYSELTIDQIGEIVLPYLNAFDYLVREKVDVISEGLADNFLTSLAGRVASYYCKPFYMGFGSYWWSDGMFFVDRLDQTSSEIDERYRYYRDNPDKIDQARMAGLYARKHVVRVASGYPWRMRLQQFRARGRSYEPPSWKHWFCRRVSTAASRFLISKAIRSYGGPLDEDFLLFPLHVAPEATLLGSTPELADQFSLIKDISMNMPFGVRLYVKEHPAQQLGAGLDYGFYRRLTALPNVRYIRANASLSNLLEHRRCLGVAVINGTVGLEAAMMYRHAVFVFGRPIYGAAECFIKPSSFEDFFNQLQKRRLGKFEFDDIALYSMLHALDDTVVRAPVDLRDFKTWTEYAYGAIPIYRQFLLNCLARFGSGAGGNVTSALPTVQQAGP